MDLFVMFEKIEKISADPYAWADQLNLSLKGFNFNIFQKFKRVQKTALYGSLVCLVAWILFGFDSTPLQFIHVLYEGIPGFLAGDLTFADLGAIYSLYYGKEMHYSAFVIYFGLFYFMSRSWEKAGVTKSKNIVFSSAGMLLSIAVFEWFWILSFSYFQNQPWVSTWQFPQAKILIQNSIFSLAGGITLLYMLIERYFWKGKEMLGRAYFFRMKEILPWILIAASILSALLWIYYPGDVQLLTVELETGELWQSSRNFPQTLYTVDLNPADDVNAGEWFWIEDDMIHAVNTGVKFLWAVTTFYIFRVRKPLKEELNENF
jgi:hypothetical protein